MNVRAKILYYLQQLCDVTAREHVYEFIYMIKKDIVKIVETVVSADDSGAANIKTVRIVRSGYSSPLLALILAQVLRGLRERNVLEVNTVAELNDLLDERERSFAHPALGPIPSGVSSANLTGRKRLDKRLVDLRLEDDRERHKRLRENIWTVPGAEELDDSCEPESDVGEDDSIGGAEDKLERRRNLIQQVS